MASSSPAHPVNFLVGPEVVSVYISLRNSKDSRVYCSAKTKGSDPGNLSGVCVCDASLEQWKYCLLAFLAEVMCTN